MCRASHPGTRITGDSIPPHEEGVPTKDRRRTADRTVATPRGGLHRRWHIVRLLATVLIAAAGFYLFTIARLIDVVQVQSAVKPFGPAAPIAFVVISAVLAAIFVPGPVLAATSGVLFGPLVGTVVTIASAIGTAAIAGLIGARAGRSSAHSLLGAARSRRLTRAIDIYGVWAVIVQRFVPGISDALASYAFGAFGLALWQLIVGSLLGSAPRAFVYTALGASLDHLDSPLGYTAIGVWLTTAVAGLYLAHRTIRRTRRDKIRLEV